MNLKCLHFATYSISVLYFFPCLENLWLKIFFTNYVIVPSLGQSLLLYYTSYLGICGCCWWFICRGNNKNFFDFFDCSTFPTVIFFVAKVLLILPLFNFYLWYFKSIQLHLFLVLAIDIAYDFIMLEQYFFVRPEICRFLLPFYLQSSKHYRHLNSFVPFI